MPTRRAAASAAASVTRTSSSARLRSGRSSSGIGVMGLRSPRSFRAACAGALTPRSASRRRRPSSPSRAGRRRGRCAARSRSRPERRAGHPHELGRPQARGPHSPDPIGIAATIARSVASSHGPCAVRRRCRPPAFHVSSYTGRNGGCASGSGAVRQTTPSRIRGSLPSRRSRGGGGSGPAERTGRAGTPGGGEQEAAGNAGAGVIEVPRHLGAAAALGHLDPAGERQRDLRQRKRPPEALVGGGDALQRLVHGPPTLRAPARGRQVGSGTEMPGIRWGLTVPFAGVPLADHGELYRRIEAAGYDDVWTSETAGYDGFTPLALAAVQTSRLRLATGVVNPFTRGPAVLAQHCAALADASGGRFVLGLGSSSNVIVERWDGVPVEKPLSRMRDTIEGLRPVLAGERGPGGFKLENPPSSEVPIVVAALRGRMLALAAELGDGAFTNFLPLSGAAQVRDAFGAPDKELVCRFFCFPAAEAEALPAARRMLVAYATVPVYAAFFRWLGWGERIDPMVSAWEDGDRKRALELVPDELVREVFVFGDGGVQRERLQAFAEAGITTFVLAPICEPGEVGSFVDALAPARG